MTVITTVINAKSVTESVVISNTKPNRDPLVREMNVEEVETKPFSFEPVPNVEDLITEDDTPMDNIFSEKQQRLLTRTLYAQWSGPGNNRPFVALANVGLFYDAKGSVIVPDVLLSLDVEMPKDVWKKSHRSYMLWEYGKPPNLVIEIVSNKKGNEDADKFSLYAKIGIMYYIIYDPRQQLSEQTLQIFKRKGSSYVELDTYWFPELNLGLREWAGTYETLESVWLRWCTEDQVLIPTGEEYSQLETQRAEQAEQQSVQERLRAEQERLRAEQAEQQSVQERLRAERAEQQSDQERQRAERLVAQLKALGIEPQA